MKGTEEVEDTGVLADDGPQSSGDGEKWGMKNGVSIGNVQIAHRSRLSGMT